MNVASPPPTAAAPIMTERRVSLIGALIVAVGPVSMALFTPAMPELVDAFGTSQAAVKMTLALYFAGFAFAQLVCGPLSDGYGRKPVIIAFMWIYLLGSVISLVAPSIEILIGARILQGIGAACGISISRAIVRDLFTDDRAARIMNLIGIILAVGPAFSPTIGGIVLELAGWHAIFWVMVIIGIVVIATTHIFLRETVVRDPSRIRPRAIVRSYATLVASPYFMLSSLTVAGAVGTLYTLATVLPFVLMERVGLTPTQFGFGMLMQSGFFFSGSIVVRILLARTVAVKLVPVGLVFIAIASVALALSLSLLEPSFLGIMSPVACFAFGIAFVMPAMSVAALAPYPRIAGSASALSGFLQMATGLVGGVATAIIGDPVLGIATVIPLFGLISILSWAGWRRLRLPVDASAISGRDRPIAPG